MNNISPLKKVQRVSPQEWKLPPLKPQLSSCDELCDGKLSRVLCCVRYDPSRAGHTFDCSSQCKRIFWPTFSRLKCAKKERVLLLWLPNNRTRLRKMMIQFGLKFLSFLPFPRGKRWWWKRTEIHVRNNDGEIFAAFFTPKSRRSKSG